MSNQIKLFDYIKILFGSDQEWESLSNYDKIKNEFMTRRFMSIKWPIQSNLFNVLKTDPVGQAESWRMITSKFNKVPGFIYTKTKKTSKNESWQPDPVVLDKYLKINEIGIRDFEMAYSLNPDEIKRTFDILEKQMIVNAN